MADDISPSKAKKPLVFLTNRVGRLLANAIRSKLADHEREVLPQHMGVLADLWICDGQRQQDLAVSLIKDKATITRTLSHLEKHNIVVRVADHHDRRNKRIYLTHKGKFLKKALMPKAEEAVQHATDGISEHELHTCYTVLERMYENLQKLHAQP